MYLSKIFKSLDPGLLFAGAAIGVSHLVQSTRAGANVIQPENEKYGELIYIVWMVVLNIISILILGKFIHRLKSLVDLATTLSFLAAPVLALINYKTVTSSDVPKEARPQGILKWFARAVVVFLIIFAPIYLYWKFIYSS